MREIPFYKEIFERNKTAIEVGAAVGRASMVATCRVGPNTLAFEIS